MSDVSIRSKRRVPLGGPMPGATMMSAPTVVSVVHIVIGGLAFSGVLLQSFLSGSAIPFTLQSMLVIVLGIGWSAGLLVSGNWLREGRHRGASLAIVVHVASGVWTLFTRSWPIQPVLMLLSVLWISPMLRDPT